MYADNIFGGVRTVDAFALAVVLADIGAIAKLHNQPTGGPLARGGPQIVQSH